MLLLENHNLRIFEQVSGQTKKLKKNSLRTRAVKVGDVVIGSGFPVTVQTMWKTPLATVSDGLVAEIERLGRIGCALLRFAVPSLEDAHVFGELAKRVPIPLVADIHFDYRIALECIRRGAAKIRINPGNIGAEWKVREVIEAAKGASIPLRIGVNEGSLPTKLRAETDTVAAILKSAETELELLEKFAFKDAVFSFKSSDVATTIEVNRLFRARYDYPLHLGVTEAGPLLPGIVKNTAALYTLLSEGIGDTIRVSLSADPEEEVRAGNEILRAVGLSKKGVNIVSCPTCGRATFPVREFYAGIENALEELGKDVTIAIMGCAVNGPGEARHADLGVTGAGKQALIFKKGEIIRRELIEDAMDAFLEELHKL
jgi:(E)-4-hydroxy-3-methylbut-2-enyl-diphosphate synthase